MKGLILQAWNRKREKNRGCLEEKKREDVGIDIWKRKKEDEGNACRNT